MLHTFSGFCTVTMFASSTLVLFVYMINYMVVSVNCKGKTKMTRELFLLAISTNPTPCNNYTKPTPGVYELHTIFSKRILVLFLESIIVWK